ncbi:hypothetical protein QQP08_001714 [Theobroma cacao]|nr:hypothetical protein QQP08_001714 [Theobroma cacao]
MVLNSLSRYALIPSTSLFQSFITCLGTRAFAGSCFHLKQFFHRPITDESILHQSSSWLIRDAAIPIITLIVGGNLLRGLKGPGTITQLFKAGESECSVIMLWTYGLASISLTLWSTVFMWLVG